VPNFIQLVKDLGSAEASFVNADGSTTLLSSTVPDDADGNSYFTGIESLWSFGVIHNLISGDFNGDGVDDLAVSDHQGEIGLLLSDNNEWQFQYLVKDLGSAEASFVNAEGSTTLLTSTVPKALTLDTSIHLAKAYACFELISDMSVVPPCRAQKRSSAS